jgi:thiamine pyrophosphate-dependent acetolactate synthase large subunit-like protein
MKTAEMISEILKREGVDILNGYPDNDLLEYGARVDIRPVIIRQERTGLHMAEAISRLSSGQRIGVFTMQYGPGTENAFGGVAQAFGESVPILVLPTGYPRRRAQVSPNFNPMANFQQVTKSVESITTAAEIPNVMRRAFSRLRNGRPGPVMVEIPIDVMDDETLAGPLVYDPPPTTRSGPDPDAVREAAEVLAGAKRPVIYAGQGVHYAQAWPQLRVLAELLAAPVTTSLQGKSAFPEAHPLALGSGGLAVPRAVHEYLHKADVILGIGCSFTETAFGVAMPADKTIIHATLDPLDLNKEVVAQHVVIGDAGLILDGLIAELEDRLKGKPRDQGSVTADIARIKKAWLDEWMADLTSSETPLSPYRVLRDLAQTVDRENTIITHDAGSPRDQLSPFWESVAPLSYIGWGKTTQLGTGLGLAMGAKLARPEALCVNVWGDAAIGFTGMDLETTVRERIPILSILLNNSSMAIELDRMVVSTEKYRSTDISGDYAAMARAFGAYGERVTEPREIIPAIRRGVEQTKNGTPALLEFITKKETRVSRYG